MGNEFLEVLHHEEVLQHRLAVAKHQSFWDVGEATEPLIHRIHSYPAKFPAFLTTKALHYAGENGLSVKKVGDVFCGCGTVALEARREGIDFWGCDLNPVATLIATTKAGTYDPTIIRQLTLEIVSAYTAISDGCNLAVLARSRLEHWFRPDQFQRLCKLLNAIHAVLEPHGEYLGAFRCAFSAILKKTSQWKLRATKPQLDAAKTPADPLWAFQKQCDLMAQAWDEHRPDRLSVQEIHTANVMTVPAPIGGVDLLVTSPPYVTSYEYADLHQLSSLWLGYADDHRTLRSGSIGSTQHGLNLNREVKHLNAIALQTVFGLYEHDRSAARSVASYYIDMQRVAVRCHAFLRPKGIGVFVIGNTEYKGVCIDNASHLAVSLMEAGFSRLKVVRRKISNKAHTPYRRRDGKLSRQHTDRQTYAEEFILLAHK
jgi:DNA modification methylase